MRLSQKQKRLQRLSLANSFSEKAIDKREVFPYNNQQCNKNTHTVVLCTIHNWREVRCESMSNVIVKENETLDSALRRFKRNCAKAGIQQEIRKREHYEKPSVRRKKKSEAARKRKYN